MKIYFNHIANHMLIIGLLFIANCQLPTANCFSQDPQFSQFYAAPLYLNPAFAGTASQSRIILNYRDQWPSITGSYVTYSGSFDHNLDIYNSGVGILFTTDKSGSGSLVSTDINLLYSYKIYLSKEIIFKPGLQFGYTFRDINYNELKFSSSFENDGSTGSYINQYAEATKVNYADISTGFLLYSKHFWLGAAAHHLNTPNQSLLKAESTLPIKTSVHAGANIPIKNTNRPSTISPVILYKAQGKFDQLDVGGYFHYDPVMFGVVWYRGLPFKHYKKGYPNHDAVVLLLGFKYEHFIMGYSYDITISKLAPSTGGSHELSLSYEFDPRRDKTRRPKRKDHIIPCPAFYNIKEAEKKWKYYHSIQYK